MSYIIIGQWGRDIYAYCGMAKQLEWVAFEDRTGPRAIWKQYRSKKTKALEFESEDRALETVKRVGGEVYHVEEKPVLVESNEVFEHPYSDLTSLPAFKKVFKGKVPTEEEDWLVVAIRRFCIINSISIPQFASLAGVTKNMVHMYMKGRIRPGKSSQKMEDFLKQKAATGFVFEDWSDDK